MKKFLLLLVAVLGTMVNVSYAQDSDDIEDMRKRCEKIAKLLEKEIEPTDNIPIDAFVVDIYMVSASTIEISQQLDVFYTDMQNGKTPALSVLNDLSGKIERQATLVANAGKLSLLAVQSAKAEKNPIRTGKLMLAMAPATKLSPLVVSESAAQVKLIAQMISSLKKN